MTDPQPLSDEEIEKLDEKLYRCTLTWDDPVEDVHEDAQGDWTRLLATIKARTQERDEFEAMYQESDRGFRDASLRHAQVARQRDEAVALMNAYADTSAMPTPKLDARRDAFLRELEKPE